MRKRRTEATYRYRAKNPTAHLASQRERMRRKRAADPEGVKAYDKAWRAANPERVNATRRAWHHANPDSVKRTRLKMAYGITPEQYDEMLVAQEHRCAVCRTDTPTGKGMWFIDHCHTTGKVRGVLCSFCNSMLGYARDNPSILAAGGAYLTANRE